ncbi:DEKNAAC102378 [Brettanomyces naardenensis]|uniref:DEKNAAC102378 n=1 Tax=Brettanomyces naardenensis TaxID=13370 RepID=A0A448YL94_BRENA|nr:DEKNAAC102378 [Brettanomyces naardenensis]
MNTFERCAKFLKPFLDRKSERQLNSPPLFVGVEGPQGSGKTTVCRQLAERLSVLYPNLNFVTFSMDDFYLTFEEQNEVAANDPTNVMLNGRGLPGTHDVDLLLKCLKQLATEKTNVDIPIYDKSQHRGRGDRVAFNKWIHIKKPTLIDVVIFEGWFNGYPSYSSEEDLISKWNKVKLRYPSVFENIGYEHIAKLNRDLVRYQAIWDYFDAFVCITTNTIDNVYKWRKQQEHDMIKQKGAGMTDDEVVQFVDRYMPVYRLYYDRLAETRKKIPSIEISIGLDRRLLPASYL